MNARITAVSILFLLILSVSAGHASGIFDETDRTVSNLMQKYSITGASLAVVKDGRLVYARGYGYADKQKKIPFKPTSLFRIASISKPITSLAVMKIIESGKGGLTLDTKVFPYLGLKPHLEPGAEVDPRLNSITVRQLLTHSGGWDSTVSGDPMFIPEAIAASMDITSPPSAKDIVRYMMGKPLDFDPGEKYAYSNFGYCVLGRVIEKATGESYEKYVEENILHPMGITDMKLGKTAAENQAPGEARYYTMYPEKVSSVFASQNGKMVPDCYGGFCIEAMDSHGGWLASVVDLARFAAALDYPDRSHIIGKSCLQKIYERPNNSTWKGTDFYYASGWLVRPVGNGKANYWHLGALRGSASMLIRRADGIDWVFFVNRDFIDDMGVYGEMDNAINSVLSNVKEWPGGDLFSKF